MRKSLIATAGAMLLLAVFALPALAQSYVGEVVIDKVVEGEDAPEEEVTWDFEFSCTFDDEPIPLGPGGPEVLEFTLGDGEAESIDNVPDGGECTVEEIGPSDGLDVDEDLLEDVFVSIQVNDDDPVVGTSATFDVDGDEDTTIDVTFTNDFGDTPVLGTAALNLTKQVDGEAAPDEGDFEFEIACSEQDTFTTSLGVDESLEGFPVTLDEEDGANCDVTEIDADGASATELVSGDVSTTDGSINVVFDPPSEDSEEEQSLSVVATNTFDEDDDDDDETEVEDREVDEEEDAVAVDDDAGDDDTAVLAFTGFELTWAMVLAVALLAAGALGLYAARRRSAGGTR